MNRYWRANGKESVLKLAQLLLLEQGIQSEESTEPDKERLQEQREWMRAYEQLKDIVISFDNKKELSRQITVSSASGPSTSKIGGANLAGCSGVDS